MKACPHCSGTSGFAYHMTVKNEMLGEWGERAEAGDSTTTTVSLAECMDCKTKMRASTAEGRRRPTKGNGDTNKGEGNEN